LWNFGTIVCFLSSGIVIILVEERSSSTDWLLCLLALITQAWFRKYRITLFVSMGVFGFIPMVRSMYIQDVVSKFLKVADLPPDVLTSDDILLRIYLVYLLLAVGFFFFMTRVPESLKRHYVFDVWVS